MTALTLEYIKTHGRYDLEDDSEDVLLESFAEAAEDVVLRYLNTSWDAMFDEYGYIPDAIKNACCMIVNSLYQNREMTAQQASRNPAFAFLLRQYKKLVL